MPALPRRAVPVLAIFAAVVLAAVGQMMWQGVRSEGAITGAAEWIWPETPEHAVPLAAYAIRDFHLDALPDAATLLALGDEEYVLYLNGHRVGSNRYRPGAPLDAYPVGPLLVTGPNRLVAELRSASGDGGFLAALTVDGTSTVVTDPTWRVVRRHRPGLVEGWTPIPDDEIATSWGRPPLGRWGKLDRTAERPLAASAGDPCHPVAAHASTGPAASFDFGRPVTGYLRLELDPEWVATEPQPLALFSTDADRGPTLPLLPVPGRPVWTDAVPQTFRHVTVTGLPTPLTATVLPVHSPTALPTPPDPTPPGLANLQPPPTPSLVEILVRRRLAKAE